MARTISGPRDPDSGVRLEPHPFQLGLDELRRRVEVLDKLLQQTRYGF